MHEMAHQVFKCKFIRFCSVGVFNTAVNYMVFASTLKLTIAPFYAAGAAGFLAGAITGFFLNRSYSFESSVSFKKGLKVYFFIQLFCLLVHLTVQVSLVLLAEMAIALSQIFGISITTIINYKLVKRYVFAESR